MKVITKLQPVIKWTGSKRHLADDIVRYFPKEIDTYYEPFIGGGSVMFKLLHTDIKVNKIICSDINEDLINLWEHIKNNSNEIILTYENMWNELNFDDDIERRKRYYYEIRDRYNKNRSPLDFLFLSRTCTNGLIRYNSQGKFNTSFHFTRKGIQPERFAKIICDWSEKLNKSKVEFINQSYENIKPSKNDFVYLDPPYFNTDAMYYGELILEDFWNWLDTLSCKYLLSFNGKRTDDKDNTYDVPKMLYKDHKYLRSGRSSFRDLNKQSTEYVSESLYIK